MKNTINVSNDRTQCECTCVDCVADDTNTIYLSLNVGNVSNPFITITNGSAISTKSLTPNSINVILIDDDLILPNGQISFTYFDADYEGTPFAIQFPESLDGNLMVVQETSTSFIAQYTAHDSTLELQPGDHIKIENGRISVITTDEAQKDNTTPITSNGVHVIVGNIDTILQTI